MKLTSTSRRRRLGLAGVLVIAAGLLIWASPDARADQATEHFNFNLASGGAGVEYGDPSTSVDAGRDAVADRTYDSLISFTPTTAALNELCLWQGKRIQDRLATSSWVMGRSSQQHLASLSECSAGTARSMVGGSEYGVSAFYRGTYYGREDYMSCNDAANGLTCLPNPSPTERSEQRRMLCVLVHLTSDGRNDFRLCSVHLINVRGVVYAGGISDADYNQRQVNAIRDAMNPKAAVGSAIIIAGDFNATPSELAVLDPQFIDLNSPTNSATYDTPSGGTETKIDHILVTDNNGRFYSRTGSVSNPTTCTGSNIGYCSDHRILKGSAYLRSV